MPIEDKEAIEQSLALPQGTMQPSRSLTGTAEQLRFGTSRLGGRFELVAF
jgi:hypothetical protein